MLVSAVQPTHNPSVLFRTVCSFEMFDLNTARDHTVLAYSTVEMVIALYVVNTVSFCFVFGALTDSKLWIESYIKNCWAWIH